MRDKRKYSILSFVLILSLLINVFFYPIMSHGSTMEKEQIVYVDGIRFVYKIDINGNTTIVSTGKYAGAKLVLNNNGNAYAQVKNKIGVNQKYNLQINDLSKEDVDIDIYNTHHVKVDEYDSVSDLYQDDYKGQSFITLPVQLLGTMIKVLITVAATIVVGKIIYYAGAAATEAIKQEQKKKKQYFRARLSQGHVYIAYANPISLTTASNRIRNVKNLYTFRQSRARDAVLESGYGCSAKEVNKNKKPGKIYYYHFHTVPKNGAHAWFGHPITR